MRLRQWLFIAIAFGGALYGLLRLGSAVEDSAKHPEKEAAAPLLRQVPPVSLSYRVQDRGRVEEIDSPRQSQGLVDSVVDGAVVDGTEDWEEGIEDLQRIAYESEVASPPLLVGEPLDIEDLPGDGGVEDEDDTAPTITDFSDPPDAEPELPDLPE
jgi:hypothetical protein